MMLINSANSADNANSARHKHTPLLTAYAAVITLTALVPLTPSPLQNTAHAQTPSSPNAAANNANSANSADSANAKANSLTAQEAALLKKLSDADYMVRDLAMTSLLADDQLTDDTIDKLYAAATTAEQRIRLRQVAVHHTARRISLQNARPTDAAVLGMSPAAQNNLGPQNNEQADTVQSAVVVRWTFPGSVAFAHLRQGDVITLVNNKEIPAAGNAGQITSAFIQLIASRRVGDEISFRVLRDGRPLDITLKLGSGNALQSIYQSARTAQSRQFNDDVSKQIEARLEALDKLASTQAKPLTLTLPTSAADAVDATTDEAAAAKPKPADPKALNFDEIWGNADE